MNVKAEKTETKEETNYDLTWSRAVVECLSRPVSMTQYLLDKVVTGAVVTLSYMAINKGVDHFKGAKKLANRADSLTPGQN